MSRSESLQRARILESAIQVFSEKGWRGATTRLVAESAGVNSALIYYYFENKHTLFAEAVGRVIQGAFEHIVQHQRPVVNGRQRIQVLVDGIFEYYSAHPDRMQLVTIALIVHKDLFAQALSSIFSDALDGAVPLPTQILQNGMEAGELVSMHPVQAWWSIVSLCIASLHLDEVMGSLNRVALPRPNPEQRRREIVDLLADGLVVRSGPAPHRRRSSQ